MKAMNRMISRVLILMMTLMLVLAPAAGGTAEAEKQYIGDTGFLMPDEVTQVKSSGLEISESVEENGLLYNYQVVLTYDSIEDAASAYQQYRGEYFGIEFPDRKDGRGYILRMKGDPERYGTNEWTIYISEVRYIGETEFLNPDDVTAMSVSSETVQLSDEENKDYDYKVIFTYSTASLVDRVYADYKNYLAKEFPDQRDSKGFRIKLGTSYVSSSMSVYIGKEDENLADLEEMKKAVVGKYLQIRSSGWSDKDVEQMWKDRSYYSWLEISEDGNVRMYIYNNGEVTKLDYVEKVENILPLIKEDTIDLGDTAYKKTDEIP